ncbi:MAG: hypothetical protein ACTS85_00255 [Arsenophonus sp. NC-PG7-MAG3]
MSESLNRISMITMGDDALDFLECNGKNIPGHMAPTSLATQNN